MGKYTLTDIKEAFLFCCGLYGFEDGEAEWRENFRPALEGSFEDRMEDKADRN